MIPAGFDQLRREFWCEGLPRGTGEVAVADIAVCASRGHRGVDRSSARLLKEHEVDPGNQGSWGVFL